MQIALLNVRLSYAQIYAAKSVNDGEPRFSCTFLLDKEKDAKQIETVKKAIAEIVKEKFKGKSLPADKICLRDGDEKDSDGYQGCMFVSASNAKRPMVVNRAKGPVAEGEPQAPYSGCYVDGVVRLWAQDNKYGKRVNASLEVVRFVKDGEAFGAPKVDLDSALPDLQDEDDDLV